MVTKFDIVEHLAAPPRRLSPLIADVMMPLAISLDDNATVAGAAALMAMDVTRWLAQDDELQR